MDKAKIPVAQRAALALLLDDHREVKKLFGEFEKSKDDAAKFSISEKTCQMLSVHAQIEEEIFYPALRGVSDKIDDMLNEAAVEHQVAKDLIAKLEAVDEGDAMLEAEYKVLTEYVGHHVEEEETELFVQVIKAGIDLKDVAEQLKERKSELLMAEA
ncbi:MAG: hemerythrin protein [Rhodocyclales bacterium]|nr:hemerythrin protein [Rhodocyclales bacterium]